MVFFCHRIVYYDIVVCLIILACVRKIIKHTIFHAINTTMKISIIAAVSKNNVIGFENQMPWHLPADLKHFKKVTMGKPIIMGRKTFDSIGKALPGRTNIIITKNPHFKLTEPNTMVVHSLDEAIKAAGDADEVMIIGGANVYAQALPHSNLIYLTRIQQEFNGDTFFPELDWSKWNEIEREDFTPDEKNPYHYSFITLKQKNEHNRFSEKDLSSGFPGQAAE